MRITLACLILLALCPVINAQEIGIFEEVTAGNFCGIGARQMAMGGTGIASSLDGGALYYNPAALARIHRIEFQLGMTHQKFSNETSQAPGRYAADSYTSIINTADVDRTKTRLGTVNLTVPVPTYRGSLVVAFGINRIMSFDRVARLRVLDENGNLQVSDDAREHESGSIYLYSGGAGIELSPNVSVGAALQVYSGVDEFTYNYLYSDDILGSSGGSDFQITEDYIGASIKAGLLVRPNENLALGLTIESPLDWQVEQKTFEGGYTDLVEYDLTRPFILGAGVAFRRGSLTLAGDAEYIDWSQLSYGDNPYMEIQNDVVSELYRDVFNLRVGAEYEFPRLGLALRAGLFSTPLAGDKGFVGYDDSGDIVRYDGTVDRIDDDRMGFSLGFGWLIDRVLMLEAAYVDESYSYRYVGPNSIATTADDDLGRAYLTLSYRY